MSKAKRSKSARWRKGSRNSRTVRSVDLQNINWSRVRWGKLDHVFATLEPESLIALISAAADSPGCGHRLPSLSLLWLRAVTRRPLGSVQAQPADLPRLLVAARHAAPQLSYLEDYWSPDPRLVVRYAVGQDRLRIHPGSFADPSKLLRMTESIARAIDPFVLERHQFSLTDLLEVALRYSDWRIGLISPHWPTGPLPKDTPEPDDESAQERSVRIATTPIAFEPGEFDPDLEMKAAPELSIGNCSNPARAARAWEWVTLASDSYQLNLGPMAEPLGTTLAIRSLRCHSVPAAFVLSGLSAAMQVLAAEAASDERSLKALQDYTMFQTLQIFGRTTQLLEDPPDVPHDAGSSLTPQHFPVLAESPDKRHIFLFRVIAALDGTGLIHAIEKTEEELRQIGIQQLREVDGSIEHTAMVHRIVLYGGPLQLKPADRPGLAFLHVEDLASIKLDAQQSELGLDLIFQFLDELVTMPGVESLFALDAIDIWSRWKTNGVLNPTGASDIALPIIGAVDDEAWLTSVAWEPIEAVLTAAGLPSISQWRIAHLDEPGQASMWTEQRQAYLILAQPPLIISTSLNNGLVDLGMDPSFGVGVADGILLTCANFPTVSAGIALPGGRPLRIILESTAKRSPGAGADCIGIGCRTVSEPQPIINLLLGPDWLESLAADPQKAHQALGNGLAYGLDQLNQVQQDADWPLVRKEFVAAWDAAPFVGMLQAKETTLNFRSKGQVRLPRSRATEARALRALAAAVLSNGVGPCELLGADAVELCHTKIVPAINLALEHAIAEWSQDAIYVVAEHLNDAHGERARASSELELALSAPWGSNWQALALDAPDPSEQTRPLEILLEFLLTGSSVGSVVPDRFDVAEVVDLTYLAIQIGSSLSGADRGLHELAVLVGEGGITHVIPGPTLDSAQSDSEGQGYRSQIQVDIPSYMAADRAHRFRLRDSQELKPHASLEPAEEHPRMANAFVSLASLDVPKSLLEADRIMLRHCGTGIDGIQAALGTAITWTSGGDRVVSVLRSELRDAAQIWSSLPEEEIEAALDRLVLDPTRLREERVLYWEQDRRRNRLATKPLIMLNDRLLIIPWQIYATQSVYMRYALEGRLPWHPSDTPEPVRIAFNKYRQLANRDLERASEQVAANLHLPHKKNIHENEARRLGFRLPGEIDLLIVDAARSRLWVCEVKDVSAAFSPRTIRGRIDKFLNDEDYIDKLLERAKAIESDPAAAAMLVAAPEASGPWRVIPLMITRSVEPAAFLKDIPVTFTVIDDLATVLQSDSEPCLGHTPIGSA